MSTINSLALCLQEETSTKEENTVGRKTDHHLPTSQPIDGSGWTKRTPVSHTHRRLPRLTCYVEG
ncbi:unnamed protein product [Musa acuminata subsp. burmannicoides]